MMHESQVTGWRSNWFVQNVLTEIPVVGGVFAANNAPAMIFYAGKSIAMIGGGTLGMMFNIVAAPAEEDTEATAWTKMTANMAAGSALVTMTYNMGVLWAKSTYQCCKYNFFVSPKNEAEVEMQPENGQDQDQNTDSNFYSRLLTNFST